MAPMICCRLIILLCLLCFTACGVSSSFLPLFRASILNKDEATSSTGGASGVVKSTIYYWYVETAHSVPTGGVSSLRLHNSDRTCETNRLYFTVSAALSTAGGALGAVATLMAATWVYAGIDSCFHTFVAFITLVSSVSYAVALTMVMLSYMYTTCADDDAHRTAPIKDMNPPHKMVEGFVLLCIAVGGLFLSFLVVVAHFCCCGDASDYHPRRIRHDDDDDDDDDGASYRSDSLSASSRGSSVSSIRNVDRSFSRVPSTVRRARVEDGMSRRSSASDLRQPSMLYKGAASQSNSRSQSHQSSMQSVSRPSSMRSASSSAGGSSRMPSVGSRRR